MAFLLRIQMFWQLFDMYLTFIKTILSVFGGFADRMWVVRAIGLHFAVKGGWERMFLHGAPLLRFLTIIILQAC